MTATVLSTRNLTKHYGSGDTRFDALKGIDLDILEGESVAIVGKSGSGKSTLMHILALLDAPSSGELVVDGHSAATLKGKALNSLRNRTFGFVFQQFFLNANASVLENVMLPLKIARMGSRERKRVAMATLELLELGDKAGNKALNLSGGQKQRVVIARAIVNSPRIIFADEPTGNLDSATGRIVEDLLFDLNRERGITLVIVTHDEDLAARADRRIYLHDGLLVAAIDEPAATAGRHA
ncbi:MAG: ABC transporter ATP-binding protein [Burkholderiaceae bacterium]|nr:ABC transporter ATP-binding protein [Microbacteriaceae bacterium]